MFINCKGCNLPLSSDRKEICRLRSPEGEIQDVCHVCYELAAVVNESPYLAKVQQAWLQEQKRKKGLSSGGKYLES